MFTVKFYLKLLKIFLPVFVVTLPLANRDIFSVVFSRIFPTRLVLVWLIFSGALFFFFYKNNWRTKKELIVNWLKNDQLFKLLLFLLIIRLISVKNSLNYSASLDLLLFYASVVALYLILKFIYLQERRYMGRIWRLHLITVSLIVLYGFLELVLSFFGIRLPGVLVGSTFVRIPATFYDANHLPAYLITAFPSIFVAFFYVKRGIQKMLISLLLGLFALVLLFTFSRSGFLSFLVAFVLLAVIFVVKGYWRKVLTIFFIFLFTLVIIFLTSQTQLSIFTRLSSFLNLEDKSTVAHGLLAYGSLELLKKSPIIGLGYGSFSEHFRQSSIGIEHSFFDTATQVRIPAHSIWLEVLVETGILGFVIYLWMVITIVEQPFKALKKIKIKRIYLNQLALFSSLIGILTSGLFYSYNLEFFWFFLFMVYFQSRNFLEASEPALPKAPILEAGDKETVPWGYLIQILIIGITAAVLIFYKIGTATIQSGNEGVAAKIGWDMRRDWGYGVKKWWLPNYNGQVNASPPLPFWLNAFWTFLFDLGSWVPRFFPAFFAWLGVLCTFAFYRRVRGFRFADTAVFLIFSLPFFLLAVRFGGDSGYIFFFSSAILLFLSYLTAESKFLILPLVFLLSLFSLTNYTGYGLGLVASSLYLLWLWRISRNRIYALLILPLVSSVFPLVFWLHSLLSQQPELLKFSLFFSSWTSLFWVFLFMALPLLVYPLAIIFGGSLSRRWIWGLIFLVIFSFFRSLAVQTDISLSQLVQKRTDINRDGRIPVYIATRPTSDLYYYSQVPIIQISTDGLKEVFKTEDYFYAIFDGGFLRKLREESLSNFNSLEVRGNFVLIERPGKLK